MILADDAEPSYVLKKTKEKLGVKPGEDFVQFLFKGNEHVLVRGFGFNETIEP